MQANMEISPEYTQGTDEWLELRKTKVTATDAPVIMGMKSKSPLELYNEKLSLIVLENKVTPMMQRGRDLEPVARDLFNLKTGFNVQPKVIVNDWLMASLDGISACGQYVVEIKCPGQANHSLAVQGKVPDEYYPQLQHIMVVCNIREMYYFSFDGSDGEILKVYRDDSYCKNMIEKEWEFYQCMLERVPPEMNENDYRIRNDCLWNECSMELKEIRATLKELKKKEEELENQLIFLAEDTNTKGNGVSLCKIVRKGTVDYLAIPELLSVDLEKYRKHPIISWRISCQ